MVFPRQGVKNSETVILTWNQNPILCPCRGLTTLFNTVKGANNGIHYTTCKFITLLIKCPAVWTVLEKKGLKLVLWFASNTILCFNKILFRKEYVTLHRSTTVHDHLCYLFAVDNQTINCTSFLKTFSGHCTKETFYNLRMFFKKNKVPTNNKSKKIIKII